MSEAIQLEDKILYDLLVCCKWPETTSGAPADEESSLWRSMAAFVKAFLRISVEKIQHPLRALSGGTPSVPAALLSLIGSKLSWQLALSSGAKYLAVLKDDALEIRHLSDDFEVTCKEIYTCTIPVDLMPTWRKVVWSLDSSLIALGMSNGEVLVVNRRGLVFCRLIGKVAIEDVTKSSFCHAIAGLTFLPRTDGRILCVLFRNGQLNTYHLKTKENGETMVTGDPVLLHSFSYADYLPCGVSAMVYSPKHNMLIIGSCPQTDGELKCVSGWRLLEIPPYWDPLPGHEIKKKQRRLFSSLGRANADVNNMVFQMSLSPSCDRLATIDAAGHLSLWELPSFRLKKKWTPHELPQVTHPDVPQRKGIVLPLDVSWWSEEALLLVNSASQVFVLSVANLEPLLREFSEQGSCITQAYNGQFLMLQCESRTGSLSQMGPYNLPPLSEDSDLCPEQASPEQDGGDEKEREGNDKILDERFSIAQATSSILKHILFFLTESERFSPPRKKQKVLYRTHLLTCLKSMTPEECYERKMENEEYEEALVLAQQYGLNCDLVYQTQWHSYPVTTETIENYLAKISNHTCVIKECSSRVPDDYATAKELLLYGLARTSFSELCAAAGDDDESPFPPLEQHRSAQQYSDTQHVSRTGEEEKEMDKDLKSITAQLSKWDRLSSMQFSICQNRHLLLTFLDRLSTYEVIAGSESLDAEFYNKEVFEDFRSGNLIMIAVTYARESNYKALKALFTYHGELLLPHRLAILSNFPETTSPRCYKSLLPELSQSGEEIEWKQSMHRSPDWVESEELRRLCHIFDEAHASHADFLYEKNPCWKKYIRPASCDVLTDWFTERATDIEELSGQVDSALELVLIGMENGVKGLNLLHHHLQTLYTLVYKSNTDNRLSLSRLQSLNNLDVVNLMLRECEETEFIIDFIERAVPFLSRLEQLKSGNGKQCLFEYMTTVAKEDLGSCLAVFLQSTGKGPRGSHVPVIKDRHELVELALKCVYACKRGDQVDVVDQIKNCLDDIAGSVNKELHAQVCVLGKLTSAAKILQLYGVKFPLCYIKDNQANTEEAKKLMIKLTRVANRQDTPKTDSSLSNLLQDMLALQSEVFTCVSQDTCHEIFTESLLCSNNISTIILAGELLTVTSSPPPTSSSSVPAQTGSAAPSFNYSLSYDTSLDLVHRAAKEYFNSAQSFMHDDMNLARKCLDLFPTPPPPELRSELNLIASLALLDDFGVKMLPIQVRLCENKLDLIRNCLDSSPLAYKNYHAILRLSRLLGLDTVTDDSYSDEDLTDRDHLSKSKVSEGRGHSLIVIALTALQNKDFTIVYQLCSNLMDACFSPAWEVCRSLALDSAFTDLPAKMILLNFCVTHCPPEDIVDILKDRQAFEIQLLCTKCCAITVPQKRAVGSVGQVAVPRAVGHGVQQVVRKGAGALQQLMGQRVTTEPTSTSKPRLMTKCIVDLQSSSDVYPMKERVEVSLSCHPFCSSKEGNKQAQRDSTFIHFDPEAKEPAQATWQALLRAKLVTEQNEKKEDCTRVLLKLSESCSVTDTHLMLGYLLALTKAEDSAEFFSKIVPNKFSLELAIYYTCLQLYATTSSLEEPMTYPHPYLHPPVQLMEHVISHVTSVNQSNNSENYAYVSLLRKYQELLDDYTQGEVLLGLGLGIDVEQFTNDPSYKQDIILTLARSLNPKVCSISLSLSHRHGIPEWEVYMAIMDCLLTSSKLGGNVLHQKIKELGVVDPLLKHPQQTADYLRNQTYPNVPGNKYIQLIQYFTLLELCVEHGATVKDNIGISIHLRLLKKFKSALPSMDYKQLMSGHKDPLLLLTPFLSSANVHVVSKMARNIPCGVQGEGTLTPGMIFSAFALKLFWKGESIGHEAHSTADWLHRFESCHDYLIHLSAKELRHFVVGITLSQRSLMFELETRTELTKRAIKLTQQIIRKDKTVRKAPNDPFEELKHEFERVLIHLQNLSIPELQSQTSGINQEQWKKFLTEFDLSGSDPDKIHPLALEMVTSGVSLNSVQLMLSLADHVNHHKINIVDIVKESLNNCLKELEQPLEPNTSASRDYSTLETVLLSVSLQGRKSGDILVSTTEILMVLKPFCSDFTKPAIVRRAVLLLMEKHLVLPEEDRHLLLLYQTQSVVLEQFGIEASLKDISSKEAQQQLFTALLVKSDSVDKLLSLVTLLDGWEQQESRSTYVQCWVDLLLTVVRKPDALNHVVTIRAGLKDIPSEVDENLYSVLLDKNCVAEAMKFSLLSSKEDMFKNAIENILQVNSFASAVDVNVLELILVRRKAGAIEVINCPLFPLLCDYIKHPSMSQAVDRKLFSRLLQCSEANAEERLHLDSPAERLKDFIDQVHLAGFKLEAGSLLLDSHDFHPAIATLNNGLTYMKMTLK